MANIKSAAKRARQNPVRREKNRYFRVTARSYVKKARAQIDANELEAAEITVDQAIKALDKAAQKGVIHKQQCLHAENHAL